MTDREDSSHLYYPMSIQTLPWTQYDLSPWLVCPWLASAMSLMVLSRSYEGPHHQAQQLPQFLQPVDQGARRPSCLSKGKLNIIYMAEPGGKKLQSRICADQSYVALWQIIFWDLHYFDRGQLFILYCTLIQVMLFGLHFHFPAPIFALGLVIMASFFFLASSTNFR